jgi:hypothetical protein
MARVLERYHRETVNVVLQRVGFRAGDFVKNALAKAVAARRIGNLIFRFKVNGFRELRMMPIQEISKQQKKDGKEQEKREMRHRVIVRSAIQEEQDRLEAAGVVERAAHVSRGVNSRELIASGPKNCSSQEVCGAESDIAIQGGGFRAVCVMDGVHPHHRENDVMEEVIHCKSKEYRNTTEKRLLVWAAGNGNFILEYLDSLDFDKLIASQLLWKRGSRRGNELPAPHAVHTIVINLTGHSANEVAEVIMIDDDANDPTTNEPDANDPTTNEPDAKDPTTNEPDAKDPTTEKPDANDPTTNEPDAKDPTTNEPDAKDPTTEKPDAKDPTTEKPDAKDPTTEKPDATKDPTTEKPDAKHSTDGICDDTYESASSQYCTLPPDVLHYEASLFTELSLLYTQPFAKQGMAVNAGGIETLIDAFHYPIDNEAAYKFNCWKHCYIDFTEEVLLYRWDILHTLCCSFFHKDRERVKRVYTSMTYLCFMQEADNIDGDEFILLAVLMTLCVEGRPDFLVVRVRNGVFQQPELWQGTELMRNFYCDVKRLVPEQECSTCRMRYFDRHQIIYKESRLVCRSTKNPGNFDERYRTKISNVQRDAAMYTFHRGPKPRLEMMSVDPIAARRAASALKKQDEESVRLEKAAVDKSNREAVAAVKAKTKADKAEAARYVAENARVATEKARVATEKARVKAAKAKADKTKSTPRKAATPTTQNKQSDVGSPAIVAPTPEQIAIAVYEKMQHAPGSHFMSTAISPHVTPTVGKF